MDILLSLNETRVLGSLIEKEITTPDQYPLSLNALTNACNQKSNREPVLGLDEATVQATVDGLMQKHYVTDQTGFGSRVAKYKHRFCNTEFGQLNFTAQELGIICVLFLRGPQTPGELRTRSNRLCKFNTMQEVDSTLEHLAERDDGPFVVKLPREAGKRESRYAHLLSGPIEITESDVQTASPSSSQNQTEKRMSTLEREVEELRAELASIKEKLASL